VKWQRRTDAERTHARARPTTGWPCAELKNTAGGAPAPQGEGHEGGAAPAGGYGLLGIDASSRGHGFRGPFGIAHHLHRELLAISESMRGSRRWRRVRRSISGSCGSPDVRHPARAASVRIGPASRCTRRAMEKDPRYPEMPARRTAPPRRELRRHPGSAHIGDSPSLTRIRGTRSPPGDCGEWPSPSAAYRPWS